MDPKAPAGIPCPLLVAVVLFAAASPAFAGNVVTDLPEHHVADPKAAPVTAANLLASERFWPYRVTLARAWQPAGGERPLAAGITGVLVRVEASGLARVDFGRYGIHEVPVGVTNLLAAANAIRLGTAEKRAPNFLFAIAPRLADPAPPKLVPYRYRDAASRRIFLCVFVDPSSPDLAALAGALAPLRDREGLLTIVFPQGPHPDAQVRRDLRALEWPVPFVFDQFSEPYTQSLIGAEAKLPALLVQSGEGRTLFASEWRPEAVAELTAALDRALGSR